MKAFLQKRYKHTKLQRAFEKRMSVEQIVIVFLYT